MGVAVNIVLGIRRFWHIAYVKFLQKNTVSYYCLFKWKKICLVVLGFMTGDGMYFTLAQLYMLKSHLNIFRQTRTKHSGHTFTRWGPQITCKAHSQVYKPILCPVLTHQMCLETFFLRVSDALAESFKTSQKPDSFKMLPNHMVPTCAIHTADILSEVCCQTVKSVPEFYLRYFTLNRHSLDFPLV